MRSNGGLNNSSNVRFLLLLTGKTHLFLPFETFLHSSGLGFKVSKSVKYATYCTNTPGSARSPLPASKRIALIAGLNHHFLMLRNRCPNLVFSFLVFHVHVYRHLKVASTGL